MRAVYVSSLDVSMRVGPPSAPKVDERLRILGRSFPTQRGVLQVLSGLPAFATRGAALFRDGEGSMVSPFLLSFVPV